MEDILIPLSFFALIAAIVLVPGWLKSRERSKMQDTVRYAIDKGQALPPELIEAIAKSTARPTATAAKDLRVGVVLLSLAAGIGVTFYSISSMFDNAHEAMGFGAFAAIPGFLGLAFIILSVFNKNKG